MPVIEIRPDIGGSVFLSTLAVMLFPKERDKREQWLAAGLTVSMAAGDTFPDLDLKGWAKKIEALPQGTKAALKGGFERIPRAALSGWMFLYLLSLAKHHPRHSKVMRVQALVLKFHKLKGTRPSESLVTKAWAEFRSVSHLWAAHNYLGCQDWKTASIGLKSSLLSKAEGFRRAAEREGLLTFIERWRAPEDIEPEEFEMPPLSERMVDYLDNEFLGGRR